MKEQSRDNSAAWIRVLIPPQGINRTIWHISLSSSTGTTVPTQVEDGNFRLSIRFLEHHPITSPPATQKEVTYPIALTPNFAFKNSSWKPREFQFISVQSHSPVQLCNPMDCSTPDFPIIHHQLPELTQSHVHWVGDATQPSYPLLSLGFLFVFFLSKEARNQTQRNGPHLLEAWLWKES